MRTHILISMVIALAGPGCDTQDDTREQVQDLQFTALVDNDGDGLSYNDVTSSIRLSDYFADNQPDTRLILLNAAAGWCDPCAREAAALPDFTAEYGPRGVVTLTALLQDQSGDPCDEEFARLWAETFSLANPVLIDTDFQTGLYFNANTMPANMVIDARTHEILLIATGAGVGEDPLREYRQFFDSVLDTP